MKKLLVIVQLFLIFGLVFSTAFNVSARSLGKPEQTDYRIARFVIGSGGITGSTGTNYSLSATAGETFVGNIQSANNNLLSGYWHKGVIETPNGEQNNEKPAVPEAVELHQNYPNPFSSQTTIEYGLPNPSEVSIEIYNLFGQRIHLLLNSQVQGPGYMKIIWNGCDDHGIPVAPGIYLYRITVSNVTQGNHKNGTLFQLTQKMLVIK